MKNEKENKNKIKKPKPMRPDVSDLLCFILIYNIK